MWFRLASLGCLVGCTSGPVVDFDFCADQHVEGDLVVCDRAFDAAPRVHLPPDDATTLYAGFGFMLRDGRHAVLVDDQGDISFLSADAASRAPAAFAWPSYEFVERIYRLTGTQETRSDGTIAIHDPQVDVALRITPDVIDGNLLGTWEGTLSQRTADNQYDETARIPIRVTLDHFGAQHHDLPVWDPYQADAPVLTYANYVQGTIANATASVTLADGTCAPALASLGAANPRFDYPDLANVELVRQLAMHALGDTQLLFTGWMGNMAMATPAALIQTAPSGAYTEYGAYPHAAPNGQHLDHFVRVSGGGLACN